MLEVQPKEGRSKGTAPSRQKLTVGILGAGTVGGGLIRLIQDNLSHFALPIEVKRVGVRSIDKARNFSLPENVLTNDLKSIVEDPSIDIIVEVMGGLEPARTYLEAALRLGKHVVTANKFVVSEWGDHLGQLAAAQGREFHYEASVAGSIPIVQILKEGVIPDRIVSVFAILNGTSNFILTRMTERGEDFHAALAMAQEQGFSEPDPSFDVSGKDAGQKLSILISILKHRHCHPAQIDIRGIDRLSPWDLQFAAQQNWIVKPLSIYEEAAGSGFASVEPVFVSRTSVFAAARNEYNAICFDCQHIGKQVFIGKGAGELPTAAALLSDVRKIALLREGTTHRQHVHLEVDDPTDLRSSIENPRACQFYVNCCPRNPDKRRKIYEVFSQDSELIQERSLCTQRSFGLAVVTKSIRHSELFRILELVLSFDPEAEVSWVRILPDV
jgi:homoserine dehydrogenase